MFPGQENRNKPQNVFLLEESHRELHVFVKSILTEIIAQEKKIRKVISNLKHWYELRMCCYDRKSVYCQLVFIIVELGEHHFPENGFHQERYFG